MAGSFLLAFAVIIIVVVFLYMSMRSDWDPSKPKTYHEKYQIALTSGFAGDSIKMMIGDSVIFNGLVTEEPLVLNINRFEQNSSLLVIDPKTDAIGIIELSQKGGIYNLINRDNRVSVLP